MTDLIFNDLKITLKNHPNDQGPSSSDEGTPTPNLFFFLETQSFFLNFINPKIFESFKS